MIWVVFAILTGLAILAVLWPLARGRAASGALRVDRELYQAEIADIDRDVERGLTSPDDAVSAKAEAARRLIAASEPAATSPGEGSTFNRRAAAIAALVLIPAFAFGLYRVIGNADYPDAPLLARLSAPPDKMDFNTAIARIEQHLAEQPDDARGWEILAPQYMRLDRPADAARAWQRVIQLEGVTAERASSFGEALVYAADGEVTPQARAAFLEALKQDDTDPRARFFLGLAAEQSGDAAKAVEIWTKLLNDSPPDAPFAPAVRDRIAALGAAAPAMSGPESPAGAAVAAMSPEDQQKFMRERIAALAARLAQNGADPDGWLRLVRAYSVLGEGDQARAALASARAALGADTAALGKLDALSRELGLGG